MLRKKQDKNSWKRDDMSRQQKDHITKFFRHRKNEKQRIANEKLARLERH